MRLYLTGPVCIEVSGTILEEPDLPGPKAVLVLARLATEHHGLVPREQLADMLWADLLPPRWETDLRSIVSRLRTALRSLDQGLGDNITATAGGYQFVLGPGDWVDMDEVPVAIHTAETAQRAGDPERAATTAWVAESIARRGFLEYSDAPWAEEQRHKLRTSRVRALDSLAEALSALGDHSDAIRHAELAIAADPFRERSHRRLITACAAAGDHAAAARAYRRCESLLATELGIAPSAETVSAYRGAVD